jgi:hypothetical protein
MEKQYKFKLIKGDFSIDEAKKMVMSLISSKINFHNLNSFSDYVRFNRDPKKVEKRIAELTTTREEILNLLEEAEKKGMKLNIKSTIAIELKD